MIPALSKTKMTEQYRQEMSWRCLTCGFRTGTKEDVEWHVKTYHE